MPPTNDRVMSRRYGQSWPSLRNNRRRGRIGQIPGLSSMGQVTAGIRMGKRRDSLPHRPRTSLASLCYTPLRTAAPFLTPPTFPITQLGQRTIFAPEIHASFLGICRWLAGKE